MLGAHNQHDAAMVGRIIPPESCLSFPTVRTKAEEQRFTMYSVTIGAISEKAWKSACGGIWVENLLILTIICMI